MKTTIFFPKTTLLIFLLFFITSFSFAQWTNISPSSNYSFFDISFPSQSVGFAIVDSANFKYIYKTQSSGTTWQRLSPNFSPVTNIDFQSIYFVDNNTGYVVFRGNNGGMNSYVFKTIDGGVNWVNKTPSNLPLGYGNSDVYFTDVNTGFVGIGEVICKTIDGGTNWITTTLPSYNSPNEIDFYDTNNGIVGTWDGTFAYKGIIYTTTNAGLTWDSLVLNSTYTMITDVDYVNNNTAYALTDDAWGIEQKIYKTVNNGVIWDTLFLGFLADSLDAANDMYFVNDTLGYLSTEKGYVFNTTDGGVTWDQEHFEAPYLDIIAFNGADLFIGGPVNMLITKVLITAIEDNIVLKKSVNFYPNPIRKNETLNFKTPISGLLQIIDLTGRIIVKTQLKNEIQFNLSNTNLMPGMYVLNIIGENVSSTKLIVE